jgi:HEAT repeat protein
MVSDDAWLRSCAAYLIGELGLTRLAPKLDEWLDDANPLLRESAREAQLKMSRV